MEVEGLVYLLKEPADVDSMRGRLQKKAEASWVITYKCVKAKQHG